MGYFGLDHYSDSDAASDAVYNAMEAMIKSLRKSLKFEGDQFNTCGIVNVALFYESFVISNGIFHSVFEEDLLGHLLYDLAQTTLKKLNKLIKETKKIEWEDKVSKKFHLKSYKRMAKSLQKFIDGV